jgi:hypothetical protein
MLGGCWGWREAGRGEGAEKDLKLVLNIFKT